MRKLKWLVVGLMAAMLVGCGKTPPDSLTEKVIRAGAEQTMLQGMEIGDFKRDNGWVENNAANLYTVKYTFNYVLKMPYGEATLENAKEIEHAYSDLDKKGDSAMFTGGLDVLGTMMATNQWVAQQGDAFKPRLLAVIRNCKPCAEYFSSEVGGKKASTNRRAAFMAAMYAMENLGFKDEAKAGDKAPRWQSHSFTKTEKGWEVAQ